MTTYAQLYAKFMTLNSLLTYLAIGVTAAAFTTQAAEKVHIDAAKLPPPANKNVTYVSDIKPLFEHSCVKCHGEQKPKGKLRLDSLEGIFKGGEDGKVVVPGKSTDSILIANIAHLGDPDEFMPPPKNKAGIAPLTKEEIGLVRAWIDQGAK